MPLFLDLIDVPSVNDFLSHVVWTASKPNLSPVLRRKLFTDMACHFLLSCNVSKNDLPPMHHANSVFYLRAISVLVVDRFHSATITLCPRPDFPALRSPVSSTRPFRINAENRAVIDE